MKKIMIDAEALKEHKFLSPQFVQIGGRRNGKTIERINLAYQKGWNDAIDAIIDNATTVEQPTGECRTCRHRDPEDKKCDCGGQERQGCPFPVSDDYFCKFYEEGEKE